MNRYQVAFSDNEYWKAWYVIDLSNEFKIVNNQMFQYAVEAQELADKLNGESGI